MNNGFSEYNQSNVQLQGFSKYYKMVNAAARGTIDREEIRKATLFIFREYLRDQRGFSITVPRRIFEKWLHSDEPLAPKILPQKFLQWLVSKTGSSPTSTEAKFQKEFAENEKFRLAFTQSFWDLIFKIYHPEAGSRQHSALRRHIAIHLHDPVTNFNEVGEFEPFLDERIPDEDLFLIPKKDDQEDLIALTENMDSVELEKVAESNTGNNGRRRTIHEIQKESAEKGLAMILGEVKFVSTDLDTAVMRIVTEYIQKFGFLELPLTSEEYSTVSIKEKGLYPDFIPDPLLVFLYGSDYYMAKEAVDLIRTQPNNELVRLFAYYFWKMALGHSKQHSEKMKTSLFVREIPRTLTREHITKEEYKTLIGRQTGNQSEKLQKGDVSKTKRSAYITHQMTNDMLEYTLQRNPLAQHYFNKIIDLFLGDFTLYISKNLYLHINRGQLPDPDYIIPKQLLEIMIRLGVIKEASDLNSYRSSGRAKAFGFMYIFWQVVKKIPLESGAVVVYERKDTAASRMTSNLGIQYADQSNIPEEFVHMEVPSRIREEQLDLSLQHAKALTLFADEVHNESGENKSEVEQ